MTKPIEIYAPKTTEIRDCRETDAEKALPYLVVMTDTFLSGWRCNHGAASYAAWACAPEHVSACEAWVRSRTDSSRVRIVRTENYQPECGMLTVYVWDHAMLAGKRAAL